MLPGDYQAPTIQGKSLRIESPTPGAARLAGTLVIDSIRARQEVHVTGLLLHDGFHVEGCAGEVNLIECEAVDDNVFELLRPGLMFYDFPDCGVADSRHTIVSSTAVTLVDCSLDGRDGAEGACDGLPGEAGLIVKDSRVAIYGDALIGGSGGDGFWCHGTYAGAGGDGLWATGHTARVYHSDVTQVGGLGGIDTDTGNNNGCDGIGARAHGGARIVSDAAVPLTLTMESLVQPGALPSYTISAPPGSSIFLMLSPRRAWREFAGTEGTLHLDAPIQSVPLGTMGATGTFTRPFPAFTPAWSLGFSSIELQAYALINGADQYSEPRPLLATSVGR